MAWPPRQPKRREEVAEILDATNWAGQRVPALTRFKRSRTEAFNTVIVAIILF